MSSRFFALKINLPLERSRAAAVFFGRGKKARALSLLVTRVIRQWPAKRDVIYRAKIYGHPRMKWWQNIGDVSRPRLSLEFYRKSEKRRGTVSSGENVRWIFFDFQDCSWRRRVDCRKQRRSSFARPNFPDPITSCRWRRRPRCVKRTVSRRPRCGTDTRPGWGRTRQGATRISARFFTWTGNTSKRRRRTAKRWGFNPATRRRSWTCTNWRRFWRDLVTRGRGRETVTRVTSVCIIRAQERPSTDSP